MRTPLWIVFNTATIRVLTIQVMRQFASGHTATAAKLIGTAIFSFGQQPCRLDNSLRCDFQWRTTSARVEGWTGTEAVRDKISVDPCRRSNFNGVELSDLAECIDIDLSFGPCTKTLTIRRLAPLSRF